MAVEAALDYEEIKGVLHVKERERDTFMQKAEEANARNIVALYHLRHDNVQLHKDLALHLSGGKHIVSKLFSPYPSLRGITRNKTIQEAVVAMDEKLFKLSRYLCRLNYQLSMLQRKLESKRQQLKEIEEDIGEIDQRATEIACLKLLNKGELSRMRAEDAWNAGQFYKKMIDHLEKDMASMLVELQTMKRTKEQKMVVLKELRKIEAMAKKECDHAQNQLVPLRADIEQKTAYYEITLRSKRKQQTEQRRETHTKITTEHKVPTYEEENPEKAMAKELAVNTELKGYQDVFELVKGALEISDIKDVLKRVHDEHERYRKLCEQLEISTGHHDELQRTLEELKADLTRLQYERQPIGPTPAMLAEMESEADELYKKLMELALKHAQKEKAIAGIKLATVAIHSKLLYVKLKPGQTVSLVGDPKKDMDVIWNKMERMINEYGEEKIDDTTADMREVQNFAELRLPEDNIRTTLRSLEYVSHENLRMELDEAQTGYVSREDIKNRAMELLKPKKKLLMSSGGGKKKKH